MYMSVCVHISVYAFMVVPVLDVHVLCSCACVWLGICLFNFVNTVFASLCVIVYAALVPVGVCM